MVFTSPSWCQDILMPIPNNELVGEFVMRRGHGLNDVSEDSPSSVCAYTGKSYSIRDIRHNVKSLSKSLSQILGWDFNHGNPEDKVVAVCSLNSIDYVPLTWAIHRLGGICLLLHPTSSASELETLMRKANCKAVFTCKPLMAQCQAAFTAINGDPSNIFLVELPLPEEQPVKISNTTISQLIADGEGLPDLQPLDLQDFDSKERLAYFCPTSGTSGFLKIAKVSHANVMANILQCTTMDSYTTASQTDVTLGILPLSHAYGLLVQHFVTFRGDCIILHPKFDMQIALKSVQQYRIVRLYLVPTIIGALATNPILFKLFDLSSVKRVITGSASLPEQVSKAINQLCPEWEINPGYGLTESFVCMSWTSPNSQYPGSTGCLLPLVEARLLDADGSDITAHGQAGDLLVRSPSVMKEYLDDDLKRDVTFDSDGWLRTGDVATFKQNPKGDSHLFIVDRKKDIMKVKGIQVPPVEIEGHLVAHPAVDDAAVVAISDEDAGERPFAFVVRSQKVMTDIDEKSLKKDISGYIQSTLSEPYWLRQNIRFIDAIPKSHNGKALKFKLKQQLVTSSA
ncbi:Acetyl-CoA synthetase-like protein [Glarea lozoyensis ATCC 20868]|uniref:Acyl-CoA ligase gloD n=1 Tax=Glarea lozoyensis (strain ATCC 20868 / MF5171) TaxID=1116229 RepID=GLOD_GLAL2|nr:Acetyl-CoA synthetase-like protein [Glarea lozoyensis ATCC 20868]S3DB78.1 RecName: Full=Acyl-CoA ligase gloD; AltName: Full=Pneumocandin biosynthesis cluster protein D [Glarea lozoyensis ATCC 20868]EPE34349.1 Acetyl-CoA synthetase-like protein [Glarea lozoyensis ATCC 20868]